MVTNFYPEIVTATIGRSQIMITIDGRQLRDREATLQFVDFPDKKYEPSGFQDNSLRFLVHPAHLSADGDVPTWREARLVVTEDPNLGFDRDIDFGLLFLAMPATAACFELKAAIVREVQESRMRCFPPQFGGVPVEECQNRNERPIFRPRTDLLVTGPGPEEVELRGQNNSDSLCVYPSEGWSFDPRRVYPKATRLAGSMRYSDCDRRQMVTWAPFSFQNTEAYFGCSAHWNPGRVELDERQGGAQPDQICFRALARPRHRDVRAWTAAQLWAVEERITRVEELSAVEPENGDCKLDWHNDLVFQLPANQGWELSAGYPGGGSETFDASGRSRTEWFAVDYNTDTRRLYVRPRLVSNP